MTNLPSAKRLLAFFALGAGLAVGVLAVYTWMQPPTHTLRAEARAEARVTRSPQSASSTHRSLAARKDTTSNKPAGALREGGLRLQPRGRSDASAVLDPQQFTDPKVQRAYALAREIPAVLNKLYCWCGCENRGVHRSNLACFEDEMAVNCAVCRGTAEIAYRMTQDGVTDAGAIQAAVDAEWMSVPARRAQQHRQG